MSARAWRRDDEVEIDLELEFHVAEATDELVAQGVPREVARERALAKLGNVSRIRAECRRARGGDEIMVVRLQWCAIALLALALGILGLHWNAQRKEHELELAYLRVELASERLAASERELAVRTAARLLERVEAGAGVLGRLVERAPSPSDIGPAPAAPAAPEGALMPVTVQMFQLWGDDLRWVDYDELDAPGQPEGSAPAPLETQRSGGEHSAPPSARQSDEPAAPTDPDGEHRER